MLIMNESPNFPVHIAYVIPAGAWDDPHRLPGLAHFVEHIIMRLPPKDFFDHSFTSYFATLGCWVDAFTTYDRTVFHVAVLPEYLQLAEQALEECLFNPRIDSIDLFLERRIVSEQVFFNHLDYHANIELFKQLYGKSSKYASRIIGTFQSIYEMDEDNILRFWRKHYTPERCTKITCIDQNLSMIGSYTQFTAPKIRIQQRTAAFAQRTDWDSYSLDLYLLLHLPHCIPMERYARLRLLCILLDQHLYFCLRHLEGLVSDIDVQLLPSPWRIHLSLQYSQQRSESLMLSFPLYLYDYRDDWDEEAIVSAVRTLKQELVENYWNPYARIYETARNLAYDPLQALDYVNTWLSDPATLVQDLAGCYETLINSEQVVGILAGNIDSETETAFTELIHRTGAGQKTARAKPVKNNDHS